MQRKKEQRKLDRRRERRTQLMQEERQRRRECMRQGSEREEDNKKVRGKEMERQRQGDRELQRPYGFPYPRRKSLDAKLCR